MFAEDTKVYKVVIFEDDGAALQQDLDNLSSWSAASGLAFNDKKCKLQTITRKRKPICTSYEVNGSTIKSCEVERDLGVSLDCDLTWHAQVSHQAARANKLLGFVDHSPFLGTESSFYRRSKINKYTLEFSSGTSTLDEDDSIFSP